MRSRHAALLLAVLVALATAAPGASAARVRPPASLEATSEAAPGGRLDMSRFPVLWETERGKLIMRKIAEDGNLGRPGLTYAVTHVVLDVPPGMARDVAAIFASIWGTREEQGTGARVLTAQAIDRENPRLYRELLNETAVTSKSIVLQTVGRNWPQVNNNGWFKLHAEIMALKAQAKARYVVAARTAGRTPEQIKAASQELDRRLQKLGEGNAYRDYLAKGFTLDHVAVGPSRLSKDDEVVRQPCGNKSGGTCSAVAPDAGYAVPTQTADDTTVALAYALAAPHLIDDALAAHDQPEAQMWAGAFATIATGFKTAYDRDLKRFPELKPRLQQARTLMNKVQKAADLQLRVLGQRDLATKVHSSRYVLQSHVERAEELDAEAAAIKQNAAKKSKKAVQNVGLACTKATALGRPATGGRRLAALVAPPLKAPCGGEEQSGLVKGLMSGDLGGVDFSTLQMRYMSDTGGRVKYSFSGRPGSPGLVQDAGSGLDAVENSTADLRTWLVLDPSEFWVNLNPDEPSRIIAPALGRTNAGKALLEADYLMKRTEGELLDPNTGLGAKYWDALMGGSTKACYSSRMWIVPGDVEVREDGSSLYILKADLAVKAKAQHIANAGKLSCVSDPASDARNERLEQRMIVPAVVKAVNTAPEYAPIRRAFLARVIAQWIRKRHQDGHRTSFDGLIGSGNIGPAKLQDGWTPRQVYDSFVRSIQNGDFTYTQTINRGGVREMRHMVTGGVDFSKIPMSAIDSARMDREHPRLPQTVEESATRPASAADGSVWLGETAESPDNGLWSRTSGTVRAFVTGRTGIAAVIVVALIVVVFGIRTGSGRGRRTS
ncbi:hypothetical protein [Actinomadura sp. NTSP31]|uniref:hypothetical protein n=1 Tax=Actinomadura sp. NTSP31 TaxID=1735447 RepID=UPI0035BFBA91